MVDEIVRYQALVKRLYEETRKGVLNWEIDNWTSKVSVSLDSYIVQISTAESPEGEPLIQVSILTSNRDHIDSFSDDDLGASDTGIEGYSTYWRLLDKLRVMASRKAKGSDAALDAIMRALDDKNIF